MSSALRGGGAAVVDPDDFRSAYPEVFSGCRYVLEEYVDTSSRDGDPFTFRILMARGVSRGKWRRVGQHIQVGFGEQIASNRSGGRAHISPYFEINRPDVSEDALEKIGKLEKSLPYLIENELGHEIPILECTIGVSSDGAVRVLSVDLFPDAHYFETHAAWARRFYYAQRLRAFRHGVQFEPQTPWLSDCDSAK